MSPPTHVASLGVPVILVLWPASFSPAPPPLQKKKTVPYRRDNKGRGDEGGKRNERMDEGTDGGDARIQICVLVRTLYIINSDD